MKTNPFNSHMDGDKYRVQSASSYFNTTNQSGTALTKFKRAAANQDELILKVFNARKRIKLTPFDVQKRLRYPISTPITSIRRSLTNLTNSGYLVKLDEMRVGAFGRPNHLWTLKTA